MPKRRSFERLFHPFNRTGAALMRKIGQTPTLLLAWVYLSFITTLTANLMSFVATESGSKFVSQLEILLDTSIFVSILVQVTQTRINRKNLALISENLLEPFKKHPKHSRQFKIVREYKKRVSIYAVAMTFFVITGFTVHGLKPLVVVSTSFNQDSVEEWPLPLGKMPFKTNSPCVYGMFYVISMTCVLTSLVMYTSWFLVLVCSTLHIQTQLKLLVEHVRALGRRAEERSEHRLSFLSRQARLKAQRQELVNFYSSECLTTALREQVKIIRRVRMLENTYRWIMLSYCKSAILITAVSLMIIFDEWNKERTVTALRINMAFSTLFFIFVNSYSGQIIINESENLRLALYGVNWTDKSKEFKMNLKIMMAGTHKPLRLTAGTVFSLSMETYKTIMEGVYSFVNFLIPLRR